jgi:hypothetical protein
MDRRDYVGSEDVLPGDYNRYLSGKDSAKPSPTRDIQYRLAKLYKVDDFNRLASSVAGAPRSESFQRFLALQQDPDLLARASMKMPNPPFGPVGSFAES